MRDTGRPSNLLFRTSQVGDQAQATVDRLRAKRYRAH